MKNALDILRDAYAHSGQWLTLLMVLLVATGISDGVSMALLYPLLQSAGIGGSSDATSGVLNAVFHHVFALLGIAPTLGHLSLLLVASFLTQSLLFTTQNWLLIDLQKRYIAAWQARLFADFISIKWPYFVTQKIGEMINCVLIECPRVGTAFFALMQVMVTSVIMGIYALIALVTSWQLMLYLIAAAILLLMVVGPIRRRTRSYGKEMSDINSELATTLNELLGGAKIIKASASEARARALMGIQIERLRHCMTLGAFLPSTVRSVFEFGAIVMILGALVYGLGSERISAAQLLLLVALVARLLPRLMQMQLFHNALNLAAPAFGVLRDTHRRFEAQSDVLGAESGGGIDPASILPAEITARDVVVRYGDHAVLDNISFVVKPGQIVGFVGPSGAGKTTLVDSILGLVVPNGGQIAVGDVPIGRIDIRRWRQTIGYVGQDTFLFHDTIANNIRWNAPDLPMSQVEEAARATGLDALIATLPAGYSTIVGDRGAKLSGGQRQRISLARALVRHPELLVLDEATSALDSLSEQEVMGVLDSLRGKMTILIVAHRFATVRIADFIYVLDKGHVVEQGTWEDLSGGKALFRRLMDAQTLGEATAAEAEAEAEAEVQ
jgi:ATP-binding cassette, subfamily C, bacterial